MEASAREQRTFPPLGDKYDLLHVVQDLEQWRKAGEIFNKTFAETADKWIAIAAAAMVTLRDFEADDVNQEWLGNYYAGMISTLSEKQMQQLKEKIKERESK